MLKKFALVLTISLLCLGCVEASCEAAKTSIGLIVKSERFELDPQVKQEILAELKQIFPAGAYSIVENSRLEDNYDSLLAGKLLKEPEQVQKETLLDLAKRNKYDCILLLVYSLETADNNNNFLNWQKNALVSLKARMIYQKTANYIYANNIVRGDSSKVKKFKDLSNLADIASAGASRCNEQLFSFLELPQAKRLIELS